MRRMQYLVLVSSLKVTSYEDNAPIRARILVPQVVLTKLSLHTTSGRNPHLWLSQSENAIKFKIGNRRFLVQPPRPVSSAFMPVECDL